MDRTTKLDALLLVSERLVSAGAVDLDARVEHCPDWAVRDLLIHIGMVQRFWTGVVSRRLTDPDDITRPTPPGDEIDVVGWCRQQTTELHSALSDVQESDRIWTWHEPDQTIGFVLTRQVNEAVVHCFDACNAVGVDSSIEPELAELGLMEFVDVFAKHLRDHAEPVPVALAPTDSEWRGTLFSETDGQAPIVYADRASTLLLALWGRATPPDPRISAAIACIDLD